MSPNYGEAMANSVDSDQTAPLRAVWSGSALLAQTYLSENLISLRYLDTLMSAQIQLSMFSVGGTFLDLYGITALSGQGYDVAWLIMYTEIRGDTLNYFSHQLFVYTDPLFL